MSNSRRYSIALGVCALLAAGILLVMPAEKTLGAVIKIVYLHGALSRAGMIGFLATGCVGLAYLVLRRPALARWSHALVLSGWLFWTLHFLVSMPATHLTWGPWVAWGEPRVTMTLQVIAAGAVVILISWLIQNSFFSAAANVLLTAAFLVLALSTGVLRHPLDPIGTSPSLELRLIYAGLLVPVIAAMLLLAWRWAIQPPLAFAALEPNAQPSGGAR